MIQGKKVILQGHILVPKDELTFIQAALLEHIEQTRNEPGCITFKIDQDKSDQCKFYVYEEFINSAAFEYHQRRAAQSAWGAASQNVTRHYQITQDDIGSKLLD